MRVLERLIPYRSKWRAERDAHAETRRLLEIERSARTSWEWATIQARNERDEARNFLAAALVSRPKGSP